MKVRQVVQKAASDGDTQGGKSAAPVCPLSAAKLPKTGSKIVRESNNRQKSNPGRCVLWVLLLQLFRIWLVVPASATIDRRSIQTLPDSMPARHTWQAAAHCHNRGRPIDTWGWASKLAKQALLTYCCLRDAPCSWELMQPTSAAVLASPLLHLSAAF